MYIYLGHLWSYNHVLQIITSEYVYLSDILMVLSHYRSNFDVLQIIISKSVYKCDIPIELDLIWSKEWALKVVQKNDIKEEKEILSSNPLLSFRQKFQGGLLA